MCCKLSHRVSVAQTCAGAGGKWAARSWSPQQRPAGQLLGHMKVCMNSGNFRPAWNTR